MSMFLAAVVFQSCTDDQSSLTDPRDAIAKDYRVTDSEGQSWDLTITKDAAEQTKVWLEGFHGYTDDKVYATLAGSTLTIPEQRTDLDYASIDGYGNISSSDIDFVYAVDEGDGWVDFTANAGDVVTANKKLTLALLSK